jgi:hypothetical protein
MINEKNLRALVEQLVALGFPGDLERALRVHGGLEPFAFSLQHTLEKEGGQLTCILHIHKSPEGQTYQCHFYEATLRRQLEVPPQVIGEVDLAVLDLRMGQVDWRTFSLPAAADFSLDDILTDLGKLSGSEDSAEWAEQLKYKHWWGTTLERYCSSYAAIRTSLEISGRFYFFEGQVPINLEDAYRFLSHKWHERRLRSKKKETDAGAADQPSAAPTVVAGKPPKGGKNPRKMHQKG